MLMAVVVYFALMARLPASSHATQIGTIEIAIVLVSLACVNSAFYFERKFVRKADASMRQNPGDAKASKRWRAGYVAIYAVSFAVALYGLVLHFLGAQFTHVVPFFVVGAAMILWFRPRIHQGTAE
jgi:uncharacterized membrane protein